MHAFERGKRVEWVGGEVTDPRVVLRSSYTSLQTTSAYIQSGRPWGALLTSEPFDCVFPKKVAR